jgi:hypothetical protein
MMRIARRALMLMIVLPFTSCAGPREAAVPAKPEVVTLAIQGMT